MKDKDELTLEALFRSGPIADDGFSHRVMARVRRRIWIRRLTMPTALAIGLGISIKPALEILGALSAVLSLLPAELMQVPADAVPQLSTFIVAGAAILAALVILPALED